jgi:signal peptidase II
VGRTARLAAWLYATATAAYLLDRLTKVWAEAALEGRPPVRVVPGVLQLNYTTNSGGAFGLGGSAPWLFAAATILVSAAIVVGSLRLSRRGAAVALGLVLGGAVGNLTDRIVRGDGFDGRVVDFIDFHVWPVFNLADSAIVVGVLLLLLSGARNREHADDAAR